MIKTLKVGNDNLVVYVPDNASGKLRSIVFIPGIGEQNSDVNGLYVNGCLSFIKNGWQPDFIVAGIQPSSQWPPATWTESMLKYLIANFPVDPNLICLTGLSAGASAVYDYIKSGLSVKIASAICFSMNIWDTPEAFWKSLPAWGLCGDADSLNMFPSMSAAWKTMQTNGWPNKPWTTMSGYGHNGWIDFYNPNYSDPSLGLTLYDWMKQFSTTQIITTMPTTTTWGKVLAQDYSAMSGVKTSPNVNVAVEGSNNFVGWIDNGDWMDFVIDVPADGLYNVDLRVSSLSAATAKLGATSFSIPPTGNFDTYKTITVQLQLVAGKQTIRLLSTSSANWNINWLNFGGTSTPVVQPTAKTLLVTLTTKIYSDGSFETVKS
jgi:hypothetical protein